MPKLIDAHTHVQVSQFKYDREEVILRALNQDIWMVNVGDDLKTSQDAVELVNKYPEGVYASIGQHPIRKEIFNYEIYKNLAENKKVVAIGECGLDYYRIDSDQIRIDSDIRVNPSRNPRESEIERQKELFLQQIKLSSETKKPLMIHCREAFSDLIEILNSQSSILNPSPGIIHFFTGNLDNAKKLLEMGFYFTFGGLITFNGSFDEVINFIPIEKILIETDAPYVAPAPHRGQRNEPAYIVEVAQKLAKLKGKSFEEFAEITVENTNRIFNLL